MPVGCSQCRDLRQIRSAAEHGLLTFHVMVAKPLAKTALELGIALAILRIGRGARAIAAKFSVDKPPREVEARLCELARLSVAVTPFVRVAVVAGEIIWSARLPAIGELSCKARIAEATATEVRVEMRLGRTDCIGDGRGEPS